MGDTNSFSVDARRSHFGVQMCSVIHVWDRSHSNHTQAYCQETRGLEELNERDLYFFIKNYFKETYLNDWDISFLKIYPYIFQRMKFARLHQKLFLDN